jgi:histidinol-phosphate aminotransferase
MLPFPINSALAQLPVYQPGRPIEEVARELNLPPETIIKVASNENPLGPSRLALAAMRKTLPKLNLYPDGNAFYLKQKLAEKLSLSPANLVLGNGSNEVIELLGHLVLENAEPTGQNPKSGITHPESSTQHAIRTTQDESHITDHASLPEVIVSQYCFAVYPIVAALFDAKLVEVPAKAYGHDLDAMLAAITPNTRLIFVANPNNPTGTSVPPDQLARFVEAVPENVLLALDEAYIEFTDDPLDLLPEIRAASRKNLLLMRTFSKIYGLAGLRLGYGIGHPELIAELEKIRQPFNINALVQAGALAALDDAEHVEKTRRLNARGLKLLSRSVRELGLEFVPSAANFILVRVGDGQRVFHHMQNLGVIARPMGGYGLPEWIRISVGTPKENARALSALVNALK